MIFSKRTKEVNMFKKIKVYAVVAVFMLLSLVLTGCFGKESSVKVKELEIYKNTNPATPGITVTLTLDKDLDLDEETNNIEVAYFVVANNKTTAIKNSVEGEDLVKHKGWAGFLVSGGEKYVKGTPDAEDYNEEFSNLLETDVEYSTQLRNGAASDGTSMEYHNLDWDEDYRFKVVVTITTKEGKSSFSETFDYVGAVA